MAIEHADFDGIERLAKFVTSTFDRPDRSPKANAKWLKKSVLGVRMIRSLLALVRCCLLKSWSVVL
jgi:hypothetical protein